MNIDNLYEVLGVTENASQDDIKRAYRKLAKENHPDTGGNEETFKKISIAYDTLSDEGKRKEYDIKRKNPFSGGNVDDIFGSMFRNSNRTQQRTVHTTNITANVGVLESYRASRHNLSYRRNIACEPCNGSGGEKKVCPTCGGTGNIVQQFGAGMFVQLIQTPCGNCNGKGTFLVNPCFLCNGSGTKVEMKSLDLSLPHGIDNGQFIRLKGMGDFRNGVFGDLVVRVDLKTQDGFSKVGNHLVYDAFMSLDELKNGEIRIPHPDGELNLKLPKTIDTSKSLRVKSKGFRLDTVGDLIVNQFVKYDRD
jgi:molecular chaperone DnaJ